MAATLALARENGLPVEEPAVLSDPFSLTMMDPGAVASQHRPDPEVLTRCTEPRALQVALRLVAFHDDFGDIKAGTRAEKKNDHECQRLRGHRERDRK